jgi:methyltransferase
MIWSVALLGAVTAERLFELWLARLNTDRLLRSGAREYGANHYPLIVGLHVCWLAGLWMLAWHNTINYEWLAVFVALQVLRVWVLVSLGRRWTTRIIVLPNSALMRRGPYRFMSHPNYAVVVGEIATLPLAFGLPLFALLFSILNGIILTIRIRAENSALLNFR